MITVSSSREVGQLRECCRLAARLRDALMARIATVVETGELGQSGGDKDTLTFKDGNFHSQGCDQYGFGDGSYTSMVKGDSIQFEVVTTSPTKGKMTWKGTVNGDKIEVGYVWVDASHWYKPNPKPLEKWAKGELKK